MRLRKSRRRAWSSWDTLSAPELTAAARLFLYVPPQSRSVPALMAICTVSVPLRVGKPPQSAVVLHQHAAVVCSGRVGMLGEASRARHSRVFGKRVLLRSLTPPQSLTTWPSWPHSFRRTSFSSHDDPQDGMPFSALSAPPAPRNRSQTPTRLSQAGRKLAGNAQEHITDAPLASVMQARKAGK